MTALSRAQKPKPHASFSRAIQFIADNDEPNEMDATTIANMLSVQAISATFDVPYEYVANAVIRARRRGNLQCR